MPISPADRQDIVELTKKLRRLQGHNRALAALVADGEANDVAITNRQAAIIALQGEIDTILANLKARP